MNNEARKIFAIGGKCPCCDRYGRIYRRSLQNRLVNVLVLMYEITEQYSPPDGWINLSEYKEEIKERCGTHEFSKLKLWSLIEQQSPFSSTWRLTESGILFLGGKVKVPRTVIVFDGQTISDAQDYVTIKDIIK